MACAKYSPQSPQAQGDAPVPTTTEAVSEREQIASQAQPVEAR